MQEMNVAMVASYELVLSLVFAMITIFLATKFINKFVLSKPVEWFIKEKHSPGCVISAALIFSVLYLARSSVEHSSLALQSLMISHKGMTLSCILISLVYFVVFYVITFIFIFLVSKIYRAMMKEINFDEHIEIHRNMALSAFLSIILTGIIVFVDKPMNHFLGSLVFYEYLDKL
jgi:uncharacterized membrane protein